MQTYTHLSYSFNKVTKEVTITGFSGSIEQIKLITDLTTTTPTVIYDPTRNGYGGTLAGSVLTLTYNTNTASFANTDKLEIIIDPAVTTQPVSLASVPSHAVTNAGTFAVQESGAALTALQLIDDTIATTASAIPTKGVAISGTDGTNARVIKTDASGELQVDVLTIPSVTGTVTANLAAGTNNIGDVDVLTLPSIPAGTNNIGDVDVLTINGVAPAFGTGVRGATVQRVTLATDDVVGITANSSVNVSQMNGVATSMGNGVSGTGVQRVTLASDSTGTLAGVTTVTTLTNQSQMGGQAIAMGTGVRSAGTQRVTIATDDLVPTKEIRASTPSQSSPSVTTSSTSILASNANRLGATIYNESGSTCLVKLGATASATSYTVQIAVGGYYEVPFQYTGVINGIVASGTATLRVTELT